MSASSLRDGGVIAPPSAKNDGGMRALSTRNMPRRRDERAEHGRLARVMRVLALETSTLAGGVALCEDGRVVGLSLLNVALTHSERLMSMVDRLLEDCRWTLAQVQGLAVSEPYGLAPMTLDDLDEVLAIEKA